MDDNTTDKAITDIVDNLPKIITSKKKCVNAFYDTDAVTAQFLILVAGIATVYLTVNIVGTVYFMKLKHLRSDNKITKLVFYMNSLALILGWVLYPLVVSIYTVEKSIKKETVLCQPKIGDVLLGYLSFVVMSLVPVIMFVANKNNSVRVDATSIISK